MHLQAFTHCQSGSRRCATSNATARPEASDILQRRAVLTSMAGAWGVTAWQPALADECKLASTSIGLQYCDLTEGDGEPAQKGTLIRAHYAGKLQSNGKQFDSSYDRNRPLTFKVGANEVIKGKSPRCIFCAMYTICSIVLDALNA